MQEQTEIINVIFDPNFQDFDQELASMSLDKMMSITYSEELLQKNFSVLISILKQLHKGMITMNAKVIDNSEWVQKLKDVSETPETKQEQKDTIQQMTEKLTQLEQQQGQQGQQNQDFALKEDLEKSNERFNKITKQLDNDVKDISTEQEQINKQIVELVTQQKDTNNQISTLTQMVEDLKNSLNGVQTELHDVEQREPQKIIEQIIVEKDKEITPAQPIAQVISASYDPEPFNQLKIQVQELQIKLIKQQDQLNLLKDQNINISQIGIVPEIDLGDINKKIDGHEEEIQRLFELIDGLKQKLKEQIPSVQQGDDYANKNDLKKLQQQFDALQTQVNLASFGGNEQEIEQNQIQMILSEINKVRDVFVDYCPLIEFTNENQKKDSKINQCIDHQEEEIEKVRREFKGKLDKKVESSDIAKLEREINLLKDYIQKQQQKSPQPRAETPLKPPPIDKELWGHVKELQLTMKEVENDLLNHKSQMNQSTSQTQMKIAELEKRIQNIQTDKIYIELQNLRETLDNVKRDQDQNKTKISNFGKKIEQIVTKEDLFTIFEPKIKQVKDDMTKIGEEMKFNMEKKADLQELKQINQAFLDQLQNVVTELIKSLANKSETKKALIYLEQKINQIFMILEGDGQKEQDSLFVKKQLPWSCASCDKDLDKYNGQLGDFKNWGKFPPKETSPERMGKFGIGYKNMIEKQKSHREKLDKERNQSESIQQNNSLLSQSQTQLPKIKQ